MTKPQILILPGWGGNADTWKPITDRAAKHMEVVCLNLPCFGDEPCPPEVWGVEEYAAYVEGEMEKHALEKPVLIGHSFGGQIAVRLAADHPEKFSGLILIGAAAIRPRRPLRRLFFFFLAKAGKLLFRLPMVEKKSALARAFLYRVTGSQDYDAASGMKRDIFRKIIRQDLRGALHHIRLPSLVLWGKKDTFVPLRYGKKIARRIPNAEIEILPEGRHGLHLQDPDHLFQLIRAFVNRIYA